jgi:hypothetical protein
LFQNPKQWKLDYVTIDESGRIFQGRLWLKKGSIAAADNYVHVSVIKDMI